MDQHTALLAARATGHRLGFALPFHQDSPTVSQPSKLPPGKPSDSQLPWARVRLGIEQQSQALAARSRLSDWRRMKRYLIATSAECSVPLSYDRSPPATGGHGAPRLKR